MIRFVLAAALLLGLAGPAAARGLGGGEALNVSLGRTVAALTICIVVAVFAVLLLRQRSGRLDLRALFNRIELRQRAVQVVETRRLSPHGDVCLLRHDGREYLVVLVAGDCRVLREIDIAPAENASPAEDAQP